MARFRGNDTEAGELQLPCPLFSFQTPVSYAHVTHEDSISAQFLLQMDELFAHLNRSLWWLCCTFSDA